MAIPTPSYPQLLPQPVHAAVALSATAFASYQPSPKPRSRIKLLGRTFLRQTGHSNFSGSHPAQQSLQAKWPHKTETFGLLGSCRQITHNGTKAVRGEFRGDPKPFLSGPSTSRASSSSTETLEMPVDAVTTPLPSASLRSTWQCGGGLSKRHRLGLSGLQSPSRPASTWHRTCCGTCDSTISGSSGTAADTISFQALCRAGGRPSVKERSHCACCMRPSGNSARQSTSERPCNCPSVIDGTSDSFRNTAGCRLRIVRWKAP